MHYQLSSWNRFARAQLRPLTHFLLETLATDYIPFHLDILLLRANIHVDGGVVGFKGGRFGDVGLLVLRFYGIVGFAAIDEMTVHTNTHSRNGMAICSYSNEDKPTSDIFLQSQLTNRTQFS